MTRFRRVQDTVLGDAMKIAQVKERLEGVIRELEQTVRILEKSIDEREEKGRADDAGG